MSIPIGIQNLTSNTLYIKEIQVEIPANQTFFIGEYDFFTLAQAQSLKDAITADQAFVVRDSVVLSKADSLAYVTTPPSGGGEANTASNVGTGAGVFKQKTGVDLEMRSISSSDFDVTQGADEIEIQAIPAMITNQSNVTPAGGMQVLLEDSGTLKRGDVSSFLGGGPPEIFTDNSFISNFDLTGQTSAFNTNTNSYNGFASSSPFYLSADVIVSRIGIEQTNATSVGVSARIGIFEYISNAGAFVPNYRFDKVYQMPTAVNAGVTGVQIFTLSPTVTLTGGKVYMAIVVHDSPTLAAGSPDKPTYFAARQLSLNNIIGRNPSSVTVLGRTLETTTNATVSGGVIASTINFTTIGTGNFSANPYIYLDIENA